MKSSQLSLKKFFGKSLVMIGLASVMMPLTIAIATSERSIDFNKSDYTAKIADYDRLSRS